VLVCDLVAIMHRHPEGLEHDLAGHRFRTALDKIRTYKLHTPFLFVNELSQYA